MTCECSQECPYCWGPQDIEKPVDTKTALRIIDKIKDVGARRIVFTGGDPLTRTDIVTLIRHAKEIGLEVALSTTGDELSPAFLKDVTPYLDLISIPLDGPTEAVNVRTKKEGHFTAVMRALAWLRDHPSIDVKMCTPVTHHNLKTVPAVVHLVAYYAGTTQARVFYNIFQVFPRAMSDVEWEKLLVSDVEFEALKSRVGTSDRIQINFLDHEVLDRLYLMVFPDGSLVVPRGSEFMSYGSFLDIEDFELAIDDSRFDRAKHLRHSKGWQKKSEH
ncbi:MAG: radical SAM protein [Hyphomicrobiaceae bacterium]|nr:radical SAM protein [Hyphomicrobiaceae bacterium]